MSLTTIWTPYTTSAFSYLSTSTSTDYRGANPVTNNNVVTISGTTTIGAPYTTSTISGSTASSSSSPLFSSSSSSTSSAFGTTSSNSGSNTALTDTPTSTSNSSTTAQTASATTSAATRSAKSKGVPTGTVVGVGFGTAIAGAFLALLVAWISLRRSRRSRRAGENSWVGEPDHLGKFGGRKDSSIGKGVSSIIALEDIPLNPADDSQIRKSMQGLHELIYQHVENHYSSWSFQGRREDLARELARGEWNDQTDPSAQTIASLLINPGTRRAAIRHIITWVILQHVDLKSDPETSLLPAHIVASGQAMLKVKRTPGEQEGKSTLFPLYIRCYKSLRWFILAFSNAFTKWRHLTASLLSPLPSRPDSVESNSNLRPAVDRNVKLLNGILQPFIKSGTEAQVAQSDNLASIVLEAAHFGLLLFSQPVLWIFGWDGKVLNQSGRDDRRSGAGNGSANKMLVVFPSVGKVIKKDGSENLRVVVDAVLERV